MSKKYYGKPEVVESYKKELSRIKRQIKSMQNRGFIIDESIIPKTPKNIKPESVRNLKKITSKSLYEKSQYYNEADQEIISGKVARGYERRGAAQKGNITKEYNEIEQYYSDLLEELNPATEPLQTLQELEQQELDILNERDEERRLDRVLDWYHDNMTYYGEPEPPTIDDANNFRETDLNFIDSVGEDLAKIPFIFYTKEGYINVEEQYLNLNEIFNNRVAGYEGKDYAECADYLRSIKAEFDSLIEELMGGPSESEKINKCYTNLFKIVKGMPLSRLEEEYLGEMSDSTDEWGEEY